MTEPIETIPHNQRYPLNYEKAGYWTVISTANRQWACIMTQRATNQAEWFGPDAVADAHHFVDLMRAGTDSAAMRAVLARAVRHDYRVK